MTFIKEIKKDNSITLYKYSGKDLKLPAADKIKEVASNSNYLKICFIDFETTGLSYSNDEVIEIGMKIIAVNKLDYKDVFCIFEYECYNDTDIIIDDEVTQLTGITKSMIEGHEIDWKRVKEAFAYSDIAIAHNASFDRHFLEKNVDVKNIWACSKADIDWRERGFMNTKLELLSIWHGFYYDSHKAMNDVNATIHLLLHPSYEKNFPLEELVENSQKTHHRIINQFPYNESLIKALKDRRGYRYNASDKSWRITFRDKERLDIEIDWLKTNIYNGYFKGKVEEISIYDKYKVK